MTIGLTPDYSNKFGTSYLDAEGRERPMHMGLVLPSLEMKFQASSMTSHYLPVVISMSNNNQNLHSI